jgi:ADP-heptose:LPS heptosyltransferase
MPRNDILSLLNEQERLAATTTRQAIIIQPGAIGDCILTLPLARYIKESLDLGGVIFLSHLSHTGIFVGRTCVDGVKSIESLKMHRFFQGRSKFDLEDHDPLLTAFAPYSWIITFLGEPGSDFEHNLIYTAHCTHSAEVITLNFKPPADTATHISRYYIDQFAVAHTPPLPMMPSNFEQPLLTAADMDKHNGIELFKTFDIDPASQKAVVIAPGSGSLTKCWPIENYFAVAQELIKDNYKVLFLLGPAELDRFPSTALQQLGNVAPVASGLSLTEVLQLLSVTNVFIGNDSGVTHLAGGLGVKTIALFGPTQSDLYKPCGRQVHTLQIPPEEFAVISPKNQNHIVRMVLSD